MESSLIFVNMYLAKIQKGQNNSSENIKQPEVLDDYLFLKKEKKEKKKLNK